MTFRRNKKAVITWYYLCGAIGGYILFINLRPENDLWEAFLAGFLFFLVPVTVFQLWFFLIGDMDIIQLDDKGISITLIRLVRKKQYEFTSWNDITAIKTKHLGRGGTVFILEACSFDEATSSYTKKNIFFGWDKKLEEYLCVNHPEIPFTPVKYGKK